MAYSRGYDQGRSYGGPVGPQRPPQRGYPQQQYSTPSQQLDQYQEDYDNGGYDGSRTGYDQGYGSQFDDGGYGRAGPTPNQAYPPQQDYYAPGPMNPGRERGRGRGRPPLRGRGGYPGPGGGRLGLPEQQGHTDPNAHRAPNASPSLRGGFGGAGPFPSFPGQQRRSDWEDEQQLSVQMGDLAVSGGRVPPPRRRVTQDSQGPSLRGPGPMGQSGDDGLGGRGPMGLPRGPPQHYGGHDLNYYSQDYAELPPRRGHPPGPGYGSQGADFYDQTLGPPERSMTMLNGDAMGSRRMALASRNDSAPYSSPMGCNIPPRPSTAQGMRQPPQRGFTPNGGPPAGTYGMPVYENRPGLGPAYGGQQRPASYDDLYDYYDDDQGFPRPARAHSDLPADIHAIPTNGSRNPFDQHVQAGAGPSGQPQRGAQRVPQLSKTKSQPDLRNSQQAILEMAGDAPPMPMPPHFPGREQRMFSPGPGAQMGLPSGPQPFRPGALPPRPGHTVPPIADGLPSHSAPMRPGLMTGSTVNLNSKPPPVRNYGGTPPGPPNPTAPPLHNNNAILANPASTEKTEGSVTVEELEHLRATIKRNPQDQASALRLAKRLLEAADLLIPNVPDVKVRTRSRERYLLDAHKILKKLSGASNPEAQFILADCLGRGLFGAEPDHKEAFTLYQSAAKQGHAAAAYRTAVCCEIGNEEGGGTRKDPLKAFQWYKRAATLGDTPAMYKVGMISLKGLLGQPRNPREAVALLKRAAERADAENPHALHELGLLYESAQPNDAITRDEAYAYQLFKQAAELGYKFSQFRMGCAFEYGLMGCPVDPRLSIMWFSRAATQEEHQSELALSGWYLTGSEGVLAQSDTEAYLWARKAAMAGLAKAEYAMGYFTEVGIGVPANLEDAKRWYWRAAAQDFPKARERLEDLKRSGRNVPRARERISRSRIEKQQEGDCSVM